MQICTKRTDVDIRPVLRMKGPNYDIVQSHGDGRKQCNCHVNLYQSLGCCWIISPLIRPRGSAHARGHGQAKKKVQRRAFMSTTGSHLFLVISSFAHRQRVDVSLRIMTSAGTWYPSACNMIGVNCVSIVMWPRVGLRCMYTRYSGTCLHGPHAWREASTMRSYYLWK